uniref:RHS repeat-associated core domain-containing protein n=1 Tax=Fulvivirga sp. TaxID=1931237 RepID=UPI00404A10AA
MAGERLGNFGNRPKKCTNAYQYQLKDHLGNTHVTFTTKPKTFNFKLNYESNSIDLDDETLFENLNNIIPADIHDYEQGNESINHDKVQVLNGSEGSVIGSVITIPVGKGDKVDASVFAKYLAPTGTSNPTAAVGNLLLAAISGTTGLSSYEGTITSGYSGSGSMVTNLYGDDLSDTEPHAFINLTFLPEDMAGDPVVAFGQVKGASSNAMAELTLPETFVVPKNGYVVIYLSNESDNLTEVYFDDLTVTIEEHPVILKEDYYPFGLTFNAYKRYDPGYKGTYKSAGLGWKDLGFRQFEPATGRFHTIDPLAELQLDQSVYQFASNNPVSNIDELGLISVADKKKRKRDKIAKKTYRAKKRQSKRNIGLELNGRTNNSSRRAKVSKTRKDKSKNDESKSSDESTESTQNEGNVIASADVKIEDLTPDLSFVNSNKDYSGVVDGPVLRNEQSKPEITPRYIPSSDRKDKNESVFLSKMYDLSIKTSDKDRVNQELYKRLPFKDALVIEKLSLTKRKNDIEGQRFNLGIEARSDYSQNNDNEVLKDNGVDPGEILVNISGLDNDFDEDGNKGLLNSLSIKYSLNRETKELEKVTSVTAVDYQGSIEEKQIFKRVTKFIKNMLNEAINQGLQDPNNIEEFLNLNVQEIKDEIDRINALVKAGGDKEDLIGINSVESEKLTGSIEKFEREQGLDTRVIILDNEMFELMKSEYEDGTRETDKDVVVLIGRDDNGTPDNPIDDTYVKHFVYKEGLFVLPTEKTLDDGVTIIQLEGTMGEFEEVRDRYIDSAIEFAELEVTDANGEPSTIDPDKEPALNIFEKAMWVITASRDLLKEVGIDEKRWNEDSGELNTWPMYLYDPAAGIGNAALDELKSIPEMVSLGLSMFDKNVRRQILESISNISWSTLKDMIGDKADQYENTPAYAGSYDATTIIVAILTGGKKILDEFGSVLKKMGKLGDINWSKIREFGFNDSQARKLGDDIAANDELADALVENADLADSWKNLGDHPNRTNVDILNSRKSFDDVDASFGKNNPHTGTEMFDPETGGYVVTHPGHNVTVGNIDSKAEFTVAEAFGRDGKKVTLLDENLPEGIPTPDASVEGLGIFDFKNISPSASNIRNNVRNKIVDVNRQADNIAINLGDKAGIDLTDVNNGILDALSTPGSHPKNIGIIYPDGTSKILTSVEFINGARF